MQHLIQNKRIRGFWLACMCVKHYVHPGVQQKSLLTEIFLRKVQNLHHLNIFIGIREEANREDMMWESSSFGLITTPTNSTLCYQNIHNERRKVGRITSNSRTKIWALRFHLLLHSYTSSFLLLFLFCTATPSLPPGEEWSSALETLRVGFTVCSLRCSGCFNDYWWHLDQLKGRFTILQGLAQVQDLKIKTEMTDNIILVSLPLFRPRNTKPTTS